MASLSHGLDFDGPFLPAGRVVFFAVDELFLLEDLALEDLALDLLGVLADEVFLEVAFELEDFGLVLELLDFTFAFGAEDFFAVDFLVTLGFAFFFGLVFCCANDEDERPIASKMASSVFII